MDSTSFAIRRATLADLAAIVALRLQFLDEVNSASATEVCPPLRENLTEYFLKTLPTGQFLAWLAEHDDEIIGTSGLVFFERPPSFNNQSGVEAYVMNMYTLPAWRGRGVASALFTQILAHLQTTCACRVSLHATSAGRPLYERFGFTASGDEMSLLLA